VLPDALLLAPEDMYTLQRNALRQCAERQDRVVLLDLRESDDTDPTYDWKTGVEEFRNSIGTKSLKYGAAYAPHLRANLHKDGTLTLPPSGAIAGVCARVDRRRGVWKAAANEVLRNVTGLTVELTEPDVEALTVNEAGKSINPIKFFEGRGHLVWGARTLAGNDPEWRYVSVRRFVNMVEESVKRGTGWAVFGPNDANTWLKVKTMLENFLTLQWRAGALQGATPDEAYFVKIGLGETMTTLDLLEGRMIVEIGMAVVRPAEFIILRFMHKMAQS